MLDLLILHPRLFWHVDRPMICNGALTLASYLAQEGFAVRLIDDNTPYKRYSLRGLQKAAEELAPRAVGISVGAMNALRSYELAAALKQAMPHVLLLGGGMHSYDAAHEMIEQSFDIVVRGEAERAMVPLLQLIREAGDRARPEGWMADRRFTERLRGIRGLVFREDGELRDTGPVELLEDLDDLPQLNFGLANIDDYVRSKTDIDQVYSQFCFQRGCPFRCTFCKSKGMPSRVRSNSTRYMIDALRHRHEAYGVKRVFLFDSNFAMPRERARDFAEQMIKTDLPGKMTLAIQSAVALPLSDDEWRLLAQASVTEVSLGIERFASEQRKRIQKAGRYEDVVSMIETLSRHGFMTVAFMLLNMPFDTEETLAEEKRLLDQNLKYIDFFYINYLVPIPGTAVSGEVADQESRPWYLRRDIAEYTMTYYDMVFLVSGPILKVNPFGLPRSTLTEIRRMKEEYHRRSALKLSSSRLFRVMLRLDLSMGWCSYCLAGISPRLEHVVFMGLKALRRRGLRKVHKTFVSKERSMAEREAEGDIR